MVSDNVFGVEPPKDADGEAIPFDTEVLYTPDWKTLHVISIKYVTKNKRWETYGYFERGFGFWEGCTDKLLLAPTDSWEKLEKDAEKAACDYADAPRDDDGFVMCDGCRFHERKECYREMVLDVLARAKKLAGIEEQEGE